MDVDIEFVGVWYVTIRLMTAQITGNFLFFRDTVDSVGLIPRHVPFTKYNACVKTFRHAIALDERRVKFKANLYDRLSNELSANADFSIHRLHDQNELAKKRAQKLWGRVRSSLRAVTAVTKSEDKKYTMAQKLQEEYTDKSKETDVLEVWFAGCHTGQSDGAHNYNHNIDGYQIQM